MRSKKQLLDQVKGDWTLAEISISYKYKVGNTKSLKTIRGIYTLVRSLWNIELIKLQEQFMVLYLNRSNKVIGYRLLNTGNMKNCPIDIKLLVSLALHCMASGVIIAHNHPSGNLQPSKSDEELTAHVKRALKLIDVKLLEHLIITETKYFSFNNEAML